MLVSAAIVEAVAAAIKELELPLVVVDPVMVSKSGASLLDADGVEMLKAELLPCAAVVTPNIPEAETLSGRRIESIEQARAAAAAIHQLGAAAVVITGGHMGGDEIVDLLFDGGIFTELHATRIDSQHTHGTGCTFASAVAANLALGHSLVDSVLRAQAYVRGAIEHALAIGRGHGPLNHFWRSSIG
jgi:hydroxymethylpyrimidine/phosphomethylpyrimidine kinase